VRWVYTPHMRHYSPIDKILIQIDAGLNTVFGHYVAQRHSPAAQFPEAHLSVEERNRSAALMRVNHSGEVCAQALYRGQLNFSRAKHTHQLLEKAASEETDHLAWCDQRLQSLKTHRSYLNFFWYWNSYALGAFAALLGDRWSLGFLKETEIQVEQHLQKHLGLLPHEDIESRAIVAQMKIDEAEHSHAAEAAGAAELPGFVKRWMGCCSKVMIHASYYL